MPTSTNARPVRPTTWRPERLSISYLNPATLDAAAIDELWAFFSRFADYDRPTWASRVQRYDEIFLGRDAQGVLRACGAVNVLLTTWRGRTHGLLYTGMTAVDPAYRGTNIIQRAGLRCYWRFRLRHPLAPVYWFFWAGTYKSYLLMARNFVDYWPQRDHAWPEREQALVAQAMTQLVGDGWDRDRGIVPRFAVFHESGVRFEVPDSTDPALCFYAERNPAHHQGDTLVCLAPLTLRNWLTVCRGMALRLRRRPTPGTVPA